MLYITRETKNNSPKPLSSKKLLKTKKLSHQIFLALPRTLDRDRKIEEQISSTELKMFKALTHGMLQDASTASQPNKKCFQTRILEGQQSLTAETLLEETKMPIDRSDCQQ